MRARIHLPDAFVGLGRWAVGLPFFVAGGWLALDQRTLVYALTAAFVAGGLGLWTSFTVYSSLPLQARRRARKFYEKGPAPALLGDQALEISDAGLSHSDAFSRSEIAWSAIVDRGLTSRHIFLFVSPVQAIVIPKSSLQGAPWEEIVSACCFSPGCRLTRRCS